MPVRSAQAEWRGDLRSGEGSLSTETGSVSGRYTFASRFEEGAGTNPEELIAAAHAGCFSMALANMLATAGSPPQRVRTSAKVHLGRVDGRMGIVRIDLITQAAVPGIDEAVFQEHAANVKRDCPVSRALSAVEITLEASLEG